MFLYPPQTEFNRVVPKTKIFAHVRVSARLKELFAKQVSEIVWKNKLSPETTNLPSRNGITEIQVFELRLKGDEIDEALLATIDRAIPFPLLFELRGEGGWRFAASYKRPHEVDSAKWVIEGCFQTPPFTVEAPRKPLPVAIDLYHLYEHLVIAHVPLQPNPKEKLSELVARFNLIASKRKAYIQLERRLAAEKQFNRKVELNAELRLLSRELTTLSKTEFAHG